MADEETHLEIRSSLTIEEVKSRLKSIMVGTSERQTQYHQKWFGSIHGDQSEFSSIYAGKHIIYYKLRFIAEQHGTTILLKNTAYQNKQIGVALLKGFGFSLGGLPFIFGIVFYDGLISLTTTICVSAIILTLSALAKAKPLSKDEFLRDPEVKILMNTVDGYL